MKAHGGRYTLVYDGTCPLCRRFAEGVRRLDREGRVCLLPGSHPEVARRWPELTPEVLEASVQLLGPGGERWEGSRAVEELTRLLPPSRFLAPLFGIPGVRSAARRLYALVARNRHLLACREHCGRGV